MRKISVFIICLVLLCAVFGGCSDQTSAQIAATTLPVYEFTTRLCQGTPLQVTRLVTEEVSCLHDYTLNVNQVKAAEAAETIVISGAGLEEFLDDILSGKEIIDASRDIRLISSEEDHHGHDHEHDTDEHNEDPDEHKGHHHDQDPHIWLSPDNAIQMAGNICSGLAARYPSYYDIFHANLEALHTDLQQLRDYGSAQLSALSCREIITFHDGFAYLADAYRLTILDAIEEESGSEASAKELIHMIEEVTIHHLPAIFTEKSGSVSAAGIIARETGAKEFTLDMAMSGESYFDAMYQNIDTLKEALQ